MRFWTSDDGTNHAVIDALRNGRFDDLAIVEPTDEELTAQKPDELERSRRHLRTIVDNYWDPPGDATTKAPTNPPKTTSGEPPPPSPTSWTPGKTHPIDSASSPRGHQR